MPSSGEHTKEPIVAAIQMCSSQNIDDNLNVARQLIQEAVLKKAQLIVLPENFAFMGLKNEDRLKIKEELGKGKIQDFLSHMAKENQIWLVGGTLPLTCHHSNKTSATCLVYNAKGLLAARYDKIHLFDAIVSTDEEHQESKFVEPGNEITTIKTPIGKLGLAVCFDVRFPALFSKLSQCGVEVIALPSAFTVPTGKAHWHTLTRSRAIDTFSYIIAPDQCGTHSNGRKTYGHSLIIDPWGTILAELEGMETGVIYTKIDLEKVYQCRKAIPLHQKLVSITDF